MKYLSITLCLSVLWSCSINKNATKKRTHHKRHQNIVLAPNKPKLEKEVKSMRRGPAQTFYISNSGKAGNAGTEASPYPISSFSSTAFVAGDIVLLKRGETFATGMLTPKVSGVTYGAYGVGAPPKLIGNGSKLAYLIYTDRSDLTFRDLEITDPSIDNADRSIDAKIQRAFTFEGTNCKIINCKISLVGVAGYFIGGSNTMDSCDVGNLRMVVDTDQGFQPGNDDDYGANPLVISSSNNTITNNYFHDCWATSYDYDFDGGAIELYGSNMSGNLIKGNTMVDCIGIFEVTGTATNNTVTHNKIINNGSFAYFQSRNSPSFAGWKVYNNVFIENAKSRVPESRLIGGYMSTVSMDMQKNIFQISNGIRVAGSTTGINHSNNIYIGTAGYTLGANEHQLTASPFVSTTGDPVTWNYSLKPGSPSIGYESLSASQPICEPKTEQKSTACPNGGVYVQERSFVCPAGVWTEWVNVTECVSVPACEPKTETRNVACSKGQTGLIKQERYFKCPDAVWSEWIETSNTCVTAPVSFFTYDNGSKTIMLNSSYAGKWSITKKVWFWNQTVKSGTFSIGITNISVSGLKGAYTFKATNQKDLSITIK